MQTPSNVFIHKALPKTHAFSAVASYVHAK